MQKVSESQAAEILAECRAGKESGWRDLFRYYYPVAKAVASGPKFRFSQDVAEDMAQQAMIDLCRRIQKSEVRNVCGLVRTIAHNRCVDLLRKNDPLHRRTFAANQEDDVERIPVPAGISPEHAESEVYDVIRVCLKEMGNPCFGLLAERFLEEKSYKELSASQSIPSAQVGMRIMRCLEKLKKLIEQSRPSFCAELSGLYS